MINARITIETEIGIKVNAVITKNGYFKDSYNGTLIGFTSNGRAKVKSWRGTKIHALSNITTRNK